MAPARGKKRPAADGMTPPPPLPSVVDLEIVVPCYNEAGRLRVHDFVAFVRAGRARLLFVDDGSTDGTLAALHKAQRACPDRIGVLSLSSNVGKAEAVRLGMRLAMGDDDDDASLVRTGGASVGKRKRKQNQNANAAFVGFWDADLATPLDHVGLFREVFEAKPGVDMVFGARVGLLGRDIKRDARRHYLGRVFATLASVALKMPVYDTQCGAKLFRVDDTLKTALSEPFDSRWVFDCELVGRYASLRRGREEVGGSGDGSNGDARKRKKSGGSVAKPGGGAANPQKTTPVADSIYEYPLHRWEDVAGSKLRPNDILKMAWGLARLRVKYFSKVPWAPRTKKTGT